MFFLALIAYLPASWAQRLDAGYAKSGLFIDAVGGGYYANPQVQQLGDGSFIVANEYALESKESHARGQYLTRLTADGKLDKNFGDGGRVWHSIQHYKGEGRYPVVAKTAQQRDGKLLVVLNFTETSRGRSEAIVARFLPDGSLDASFAQGGLYVVELGKGGYSKLSDVRLFANGDILLVGDAEIEQAKGFPMYRGLLIRLNSAGKPVSNFGDRGIAFYDFDDKNPHGWGHTENLHDAILQADGKILIWANFQSQHLDNSKQLLRFTAQGKPDLSFGAQGAREMRLPVSVRHSSWGGDMKMMPDGKIYVIGFIWWHERRDGKHNSSPLVVRLNTDGTFDRSFGENGALLVKAASEQIYTLDILLQEDKKLLLLSSSLGGRASITRVDYYGNSDASYGTSQSTPAGMETQGMYWGKNGSIYAHGVYTYESRKESNIAFCRYAHKGSGAYDEPQPDPQPTPDPNPEPQPNPEPTPTPDVVDNPIQMRTFLHTEAEEHHFRMTLRYTQPISAQMTIYVTSPDGKTTRTIKSNVQQNAREYTEVFTLPRTIEWGTHTIHLKSSDGRIHTKVKLQISAAAAAKKAPK